MAGNILGSYIQVKGHYLLSLFCLIVLVQRTNATVFMVGGSGNWEVPSDPHTNNYNQWAQKARFQIGDSLVFNYQASQDSVLQVTNVNYDRCNTDSPLESFSDGHTSYKFNKSGHFYFISGNKDNCEKNEKLWVIVMADRNNSKNQNQPSSSPPAPTPQAVSLSPEAESGEMNPTSGPFSEPPPHSSADPSAALFNLSFLGSFGALLASSLALV